MPRIQLKPKSPEFDNSQNKTVLRCCDMPGCNLEGDFRAPKDRGLNEHYWFCLEHVREYNQAWDFFSGMSAAEIEEHILRSALWDRPTRRFDSEAEENLRQKAWSFYQNDEGFEGQKHSDHNNGSYRHIDRSSPEFEALAVMGLEPPVDLKAIKERYRELAKKLHPDRNKGDSKSEELLKQINMSYTILKLAYEKFDQLDDK